MLKIYHITILLALLLFNSSCKPKEEHLSVSFTGDVLLDRGVREQIEKKGVGYLFEDVSPQFKSSDAVVINLECPVTKNISPINKKYIFRAEPDWLTDLKKSGVTHAALANNHSMDQGRKGLVDTYHHLKHEGIETLGYGKNEEEACLPVFISKYGIDVAIFNTVTVPLENWVHLEDSPGVCQADAEILSEKIKILKVNKPSCYVVVVLHWGIEFQQEPTIKQRKDAYQLIRAGADAIIGHHPHVVQQEEIYNGKPIFYSLGNFVFDQNKPLTNKSLIVELEFYKDKILFNKYPVSIRKCRPEM